MYEKINNFFYLFFVNGKSNTEQLMNLVLKTAYKYVYNNKEALKNLKRQKNIFL